MKNNLPKSNRSGGPDSSASPEAHAGNRLVAPDDAPQDRGWHEPPRPRRDLGRPSRYSPAMADVICERLFAGEPLARMCRDPWMPDRETVRRWRQADPSFDAMFRWSQEEGWIDLAHQVVKDLERALAEGVPVARVRLMFDARRWLLARQAPEFFGSGRARVRRRGRD